MATRRQWFPVTWAIALVCCGCVTTQSALERAGAPSPLPQAEMTRQSMVSPGGPGIVPQSQGLWLFRDLRAREVGDIVTVNIVEVAKASKLATTKTARQSDIDMGIPQFFGYQEYVKKKAAESAAFDPNHLIVAHTTNDFDGSGATARDETMTASMSARVMDVLPNGNLVIRGSRQVRVNLEDQVIVLSGIIRPEDITVDNTILSSFVADAKIEYYGNGVVSEKQRPGWLARLLDYVWPF